MGKSRPTDATIISALLENPTIDAAAKACGITRQTIHNRLADPDFKREYSAMRRKVVEASCGALQGRIGEAAETLAEIMNDGKASKMARVLAAKAILEYGLKTVETLDILPRLEALEEVQRSRQGG